MTLSKVQPHLNDAFDRLRDSDDTHTEWQKFWNEKGIEEEELREAKEELINNQLILNLNEDDKLQNSENIFCCDPFDEENIKNLLSIYNTRRKSEPNHSKNFSRLYHEFNTHLSNISHRPTLSNPNSQNNPNWISNFLVHPLVSVFVEIAGFFNPIFRPILKIIVDFIKWLLPSVLLQQVIQLFQHLWKKIVAIFAWIKMYFQKHKNWIVFFVTILVMVLAIIGFSNLSTEKHQNAQIAELKAFNSNAKGILDKPKDIDSLEEALTVANELKTHINSHVKDKSYYLSIFDKEFPNYPLYTLQQVINNIHEKNRFKYEYDGLSMKAISFSSDGNLVALSTGGDKIQIQKISSLEPFKSEPDEQLNSCHSGISSLSFHPTDPNIIATGAINGGKICFLNRKKVGKKLDSITLETGKKIDSITFSPKGKFLAIAQSDGQVTLINEKNREDRWNPTKERTFDITFNYNEDKIATVSDTGEVNIWNYPTKPTNSNSQAKLPKRPPINIFKVPNYEKETNSFLRIIFTENDELLIVSESRGIFQVLKYSKKILINKVNNINPIETIELKSSQTSEIISSGSFNLKNNQLITVDSQNLVQLWDLSKSKKGNTKAKSNEQYQPVTKISLSDVSIEREKSKKNYALSLIALHKGGNITAWSMDNLRSVNADNAPVLKKIRVKDIDFNAKGKKIAILNEENGIDFVNLQLQFDGNLLKNKTEKNNFTTISFNPMQDDVVAIGTKTGAIKLFDKNENLLAEVPDPNGGSVQFIDFSPDGNLLVSIRDTLEIWNTSNNNKIEEIEISPDIDIKQKLPGDITVNIGANIALAASGTKKIELLNPKSTQSPNIIKLEPITPIDFDESKEGGIIGVSFSKKNKLFFTPSSAKDTTPFDNKLSIFSRPLLAAIDNKGLVKVWDSSSQKLISSFESEIKEIKGFIIDSNGKDIFIGGNDGKYGTIEKWKIDSLEELIKNGCKWLKDYHKHHSDSKSIKYCSKGK
jgi:WD40 repeat protein